MKLYVASSWRNTHQQSVVEALRIIGHDVYDFRDRGFSWKSISDTWEKWSPQEYESALRHEFAEQGFKRDIDAIHWCDRLIMVHPCGPSACLELGYAAGLGKSTAVYMPEIREPDLMIKVANLITTEWPKIILWLTARGG